MPSVGHDGAAARGSPAGCAASPMASGRSAGRCTPARKVTTGPDGGVRDRQASPIVVTSLHHEPWDAGIFTSVGIDPAHCRFLLLKSRIHYRAGFSPYENARVTLDGEGVTTSDNSKLSFETLQRPIWPLDPDARWPRN